MLGGQGADFLRGVAFWSIRSSGLLRPSLCVAAWRRRPSLVWQARHLWHWAGSGGALGSWWRAWVPLSPWSQRLFVWQAWHSETSSGCFSGTFFGTLLNLTWLCTKASQTFSGTFSGTLLNLPLALRQSLPDLLRNPNLTWLCTKASHSPEPDLALHQGFLEPFPGPSPEPC